GMRGDDKSGCENRAAQIERIAREGVWAGDGELAVLAEIASSRGANHQAQCSEDCSVGDLAPSGCGEKPVDDGHWIAQADAPAHPEFSRLRLSGCREAIRLLRVRHQRIPMSAQPIRRSTASTT